MIKILIDIFVLQLIFLLFYQFIKRNPYFNINRWYLLGSLFISLSLPLFDYTFATNWLLIDTNYFQGIFTLEEVLIDQNMLTDTKKTYIDSDSLPKLSWSNILLSVIFMISLIKLMISAFSFYKIIQLFKKNPYHKTDNEIKIYHLKNSTEAFTFLERIMIGDQITSPQRELIIEHEKMHARSLHSIDLIFIEIIRSLLWFDPLHYIYKREIILNHEYEADSKTAENYNKTDYINCLLNNNFKTKELEFLNPFFNQSNLKNRITMLKSNTKRPIQKFKYLLIIPAILMSFTYLSCSSDQEKKNGAIQNSTEKEEVPFTKISQVPVYPGCEEIDDNDERKKCMSQKISEFVNKRFDTSIGDSLGLSGTNRVIVQFKINSRGEVIDVRSRASDPELENEGERVVKELPDMKPGKHNGEKVDVIYQLPITFKIEE